jgi:putative protein kinase ArgK-like GTPase of G3E family
MAINFQPNPENQPQHELLHKLMQPRPIVIGIEGGPCGGKTTLAEKLKHTALSSHSYSVT